ncbi:MAG: transketolase family protein [Clostridia bacterium]|nr:transketolase family protein [Clostridia bacterium]MBP5459365.1 transketolase family protein [Clostridia bacterium]
MADIITKATRIGYAEGLLYLGETDEKVIVMDADLAGATQTAKFKAQYPDRFFNSGIAEQNMIGVASGLSLTGYTVFASSFAMFATGRAFEQIRNSVGYPHLNVKIGATHAGISVGEDGASHQCNEDIALMRSIPGMTIINPADAVEAKAATIAAAKYEGPVYLRFGRLAVPVIFGDDYEFEWGKGQVLVEGDDVAIFATGLMVNEALMAAEQLKNEGISARVINIHTIKPLDEELVVKAARECGCVVTAEEHNIIGGLGSAVCETLSENCPTPVVRVGVNDEFGRSGPAVELLHLFGLDAAHIVESARKAISLK